MHGAEPGLPVGLRVGLGEGGTAGPGDVERLDPPGQLGEQVDELRAAVGEVVDGGQQVVEVDAVQERSHQPSLAVSRESESPDEESVAT
ncbi:hypothetical protein JCM10369A_28340 [Nocardioides pyridinolyticus]